ncbi:hypothetical protein M942_22675 [Enterobacter ludwigii]|jgi:photosystem II stability/assembly factor-like uncharacterized protein|uniref:hypothetical protein n=1 Tax=Enterobacter ludwigii TaxID=299767 RepID=UPI0003D936BF|nr:hypothetical protein [Enterobacter ludwigii]AHE73424.1 hypothetical protein M942_22675 [Enterobacter ludwigii]
MASRTADLYAVAKKELFNGNALYVAVGDRGTILTSTNPGSQTAWTIANSNTTENLRGIVFTEGKDSKFYAVGDNGTIVTSEDGTTWTVSTLPVPAGFTNNLTSIAYNNQWLFAYSWNDDFNESGYSFVSQDGQAWKGLAPAFTDESAGFAIVANRFKSGRFVMTEKWSNDKVSKLTVTDSSNPAQVGSYTDLDNYSGVGGNPPIPLTDNEFLYGLATDEKGRYVAVGDNFNILMATDDNLFNWKDVNQSAMVRPRKLNSVAMSGESFMAVGDICAVLQSKDGGANWTSVDIGLIANLRGVVAASTPDPSASPSFVIVGDGGFTKVIEV